MARYVKGCADTGIMFEWQTAPRRLTVQSDSDWARDKSTRKSVSAGNVLHICFAAGAKTRPFSR